VKICRVTVEVEVPWDFTARGVLERVAQGFDELAHDVNTVAVLHQVQIVGDVMSRNTQIGSRR